MSDDSLTDPRPITEARLLSMVNASGDSFWEMDTERRFVHISDNMCRTMGYPREELRGRPVLEFMTPEYRAELIRLAAARGSGDNRLAHNNRRHFVAAAEHELERARRHGTALSLVMLDIDHFKNVNDVHGHPTGDVALKAVGSMLSATSRVGDLACRLGGEEFAVLLPGMGHEGAMGRAEKWRSTLAEMTIPADGSVLRLTASFGVATFARDAGSLVELMKVADSCLYRAKALGRDRVMGEGGQSASA
jgi:diguanylate cyclase (GGDEF)-like protein